MPEVYARHFELGTRAAEDVGPRLLNSLRDWVGSRWPKDEPWFGLQDPRRFRSQDGSIFRWEPFKEEDAALFEFTWRHRDYQKSGITWATQVSSVTVGDRTDLSLRVWNTGPEFGTEGALLTTRPRLVRHLADHFEPRTTGFRVTREPRRISEQEIPSFVRYELLEPIREAPIAVISPDRDGSWVVDPAKLTDEFLSLTEVLVIEDPDATFELTRELGHKALSCFGGAVRIYMPGFTKDSEPLEHPLLLPRRLRDREERLALSYRLARMTVSAYEPLEGIQRLRDQRAVHYDERHERLTQSLLAAQVSGADADEWRALAEAYEIENRQLQAEAEGLREHLVEAKHKVKGLQYQLRVARKASAEATPEVHVDFTPMSMLDAVEFAQTAFEDDLLILDQALSSAKESNYSNPVEIFNALKDMASIARQCRDGPLGKNLKDAFAELGWTYRGGITKGSSSANKEPARVQPRRAYARVL